VGLKHKLHSACLEFAQQGVDALNTAQKELSDDAGSEMKSSAGDKHETGRAMLQLEQEKNAEQLLKASALLKIMERIDPALRADKVALGAMVATSRGNFYIAISAGRLNIDGKDYYAISPQAPIAAKLMGAQVNHKILFNGVEYAIDEIL
jgi:hypothetical protein